LTEIDERVEYKVKNLNRFVKRLAFSQNLNRFIKTNLFRFKEIRFNIKMNEYQEIEFIDENGKVFVPEKDDGELVLNELVVYHYDVRHEFS